MWFWFFGQGGKVDFSTIFLHRPSTEAGTVVTINLLKNLHTVVLSSTAQGDLQTASRLSVIKSLTYEMWSIHQMYSNFHAGVLLVCYYLLLFIPPFLALHMEGLFPYLAGTKLQVVLSTSLLHPTSSQQPYEVD